MVDKHEANVNCTYVTIIYYIDVSKISFKKTFWHGDATFGHNLYNNL